MYQSLCLRSLINKSNQHIVEWDYWGEPERAPHIRDVCKFCLCLSVSLSVGPYVHDMIIYKCYSNLWIPSIIDCSFEQYVSQTVL